MKAVKVKENVYWVGGIDWSLRNFHGYLTQRGSTYNAYLIIDEKITLVDTVKAYLTDEMMKRIKSVIDPAKIDYVVSNHVEMDHSGALPAIMDIATNATLVTCASGDKGLKQHYKKEWKTKVIKSGETLSLGQRSLQFITTPMVHWPDNMVVYMPEEKLLFSNDSLGQHLASTERFDDEYPVDVVMEEARKYYANIVLPYAAQVTKALNEITKLDIEIIAPSHGIIWRKHVKEIVAEYVRMSSNITDKKAVIVYDTMWHSTEKIAQAIQDAFLDKGYTTVFRDLQNNHISDIMTDVLYAEYICVGSPTLNNNIMPNVAGFLMYLKGLAPKGRKAIAFGSYGWSGQSIAQVEASLKESGFDVVDTIRANYIPGEVEVAEIKAKLNEKI